MILTNNILIRYISAFLLFELLCYLANAMIMPSMIEVVSYFHAHLLDIPLTVIIYIMGVTITPLFVSPIANRFGKPKVIILGCALFTLTNLICPLSQNITEFFALRFLQGVGQGFIFLGYTMIHESFDDVSSVKLTSLMGNISVIAPIMGPPIGSIIFLSLGWKFIFFFTGVVSLFSLVGLILWSPKTIKSQALVLGFKEYIKNYKVIIANKKFMLGVVILTLAMVPSELWMIFSIIIILTTLKTSLLMYNVYMIIVTLSFIASSLTLNKIIHKLSFTKLVNLGCLISFVASVAAVLTYSNSFIFVIFLSISVFGAGLFRGIIYRRLMTDVHEDKNTISALFYLILSLFLVGVIYSAERIFKLTDYTLLSFGLCTLVASFLCLILAVYFMSLGSQAVAKKRVESSYSTNAEGTNA